MRIRTLSFLLKKSFLDRKPLGDISPIHIEFSMKWTREWEVGHAASLYFQNFENVFFTDLESADCQSISLCPTVHPTAFYLPTR